MSRRVGREVVVPAPDLKALSIALDGVERTPAWQRRKLFRPVEILAEAVTLLETSGFEAMSMAAVAQRAGVSEATIYKYFETRDGLVSLAMEAALTPLVETLEREVSLLKGCAARLEFYVATSLRDMGDRPNVHRSAHGHLRWSGNHKSILRQAHRRFAAIVGWILDQGVAENEIDPRTDLTLAGDMVFAGIEGVGWRVVMQSQGADFDITKFSAGMVAQLLGGIRRACDGAR